MDALASLLYEVRSDGALFSRNVLTPPWSIRFADRRPITLVTMLRGSGWVLPGDGASGTPDGGPVPLERGDVAIVVGPEPFSFADSADSTAPPLYVLAGPDRCTTADGEEISEDIVLGMRTCGTAWTARPCCSPAATRSAAGSRNGC
ncbi:cupin domain-containing protein [Streptomyces sp. NPDC047971]|uniref:cupin domain-containing protein n=1 Tax=Streptomyces sp. NPDC047971 TaxID=3154499 RepID=UPI0033D3A6DC